MLPAVSRDHRRPLIANSGLAAVPSGTQPGRQERLQGHMVRRWSLTRANND